MTKLLKKSVALVVVAALCLTAMVGCFTVSADGANTAAVVGSTVEVGTATATATITLGSAGFHATLLTITSDLALTGATAEGFNVEIVSDGKILIDGQENKDYTSAVIVATFDTSAAVADEYGVAIAASKAANWDETWVEFPAASGKITVGGAQPVLDKGMTFDDVSINIGSTIGVVYMIGGLADYDDVTMEIKGGRIDPYNEFKPAEKTDVVTKAQMIEYDTGCYAFIFDGIGMFELNVALNATIKGYKDGKEVAYSSTNTKSIKDLAVALYGSTANTKTKALLTDLLNLGAAAQTYFGVAGDLPNAGFDQTYATKDYGTLNNVEDTVGTATVIGDVDLAINPGLAFMAFGFNDTSNLNATVSYYDAVNKVQVNDTFTKADMLEIDGVFGVQYKNVALYAGAAPITVKFYEGENLVVTYTYSLETCLGASIGITRIHDIINAIAVFGKSAQAYFGV